MMRNKIKGSSWIKIKNFQTVKFDKFANMVNLEIDSTLNTIEKLTQKMKPPTLTLSTLEVEYDSKSKEITGIIMGIFTDYNISESVFKNSDFIAFVKESGNCEFSLESDNTKNYLVKQYKNEY